MLLRRVQETDGGVGVVVDMGRPVGFAGGAAGWSSGLPALQRVTVILEPDGERLVTAFPGVLRQRASGSWDFFEEMGLLP